MLPVALTSLAVFATVAVHPEPNVGHEPRTATAADSYDGFDAKGAEQVRQDECLMGDVLRQGGPNMFAIGQKALGQPPLSPAALHTLANREYWDETPLSQAFSKDKANADHWFTVMDNRAKAWQDSLEALVDTPPPDVPPPFTWPPGSPGSKEKDFFDQVGFGPWVAQQFWKTQDGLYNDPSAEADKATKAAFMKLGDRLYADDGPASTDLKIAWSDYSTMDHPVWADDARIFLSSGGFPTSAPKPGSLAFRIAVEDMKSRFASCNWHNPLDPNHVLGKVVKAASDEWQREIADQATQRKWVFAENKNATTALQKSAFGLGDMLASPGRPTASPTGRTTGSRVARAGSVTVRSWCSSTRRRACAWTSTATGRPTARRCRSIRATVPTRRSGFWARTIRCVG
ncbi:hypothetical protein [Streptomyces beihaiensis]|uniref:Uncharacterized protein n=1 Tax=Streptomyces beihaiensis TaxID=2984495 RepID=A0ABT3U480_9ACTN|nr:hypothetical protein [Streptomyces beihaiensis]MCX3064133.1 hypothetical protein [Streptomyces beihaiensis]